MNEGIKIVPQTRSINDEITLINITGSKILATYTIRHQHSTPAR